MKTSRHRQFSTFMAQRRNAKLHDYIARRERDARFALELYRSRRVEFGLDYEWLNKVFSHNSSTSTVVGSLLGHSDDNPPLIVCHSKDQFINCGIEFIESKLNSIACSQEAS
jgi:hypothetical protein